MLNLRLPRSRIEATILAKERQIDSAKRDASWLDHEPFWDFIDAWHDLAIYYEETEDTVFSVELLSLYAHYAALLRRVTGDDRIMLRLQEQAETALLELNDQVDKVIRQLERNSSKRHWA